MQVEPHDLDDLRDRDHDQARDEEAGDVPGRRDPIERGDPSAAPARSGPNPLGEGHGGSQARAGENVRETHEPGRRQRSALDHDTEQGRQEEHGDADQSEGRPAPARHRPPHGDAGRGRRDYQDATGEDPEHARQKGQQVGRGEGAVPQERTSLGPTADSRVPEGVFEQ